MLERLRDHLRHRELIPEGTRVLVGYSGGADSTCLLHLLWRAGVDVVAGHLHHGQREEATQEQSLCEAFAGELGVPFVTGQADVPRMAADLQIGLEEAGRKARYAFMEQAAFRLSCGLVATGHTRSDHVETILHHVARGAGLAGLSGVPERRGNVIRPLLPFSREETRGYCEAEGLWFHDDPGNSDVSFARARIRHRIIPELRLVNPGADAAIARLAEVVSEEDRFLNGTAAAALERAERPLNGDLAFLTRDVEIAFERGALATLPRVLLRRALRLAVSALGAELDHRQTLLVTEGLLEERRGSVTAEGGEVVVEWDEKAVLVREVRPTAPFRYPLTVPGETASDEFGWQFTAFHDLRSEAPARRASLQVEIDRAAIKGPLYFRTAETGDAMRPLGFEGRRKVSDLLSEAGLTAAARARLPVVCDLVGPLWIPGVCLDHRSGSRSEGQAVTILRFEPLRALDSHNEETGYAART